MQAWLADLQQLLARGEAAVLVTLARVEGSAPRDPGTKMIVTREQARHTIGGGQLEAKAIEIARQLLRDGLRVVHARRLERVALGPALGQCGGGAVVLAFERLDVGDLGWLASLAKRLAAGASTVRTVSFGPSADAVMLSEPEPGADAQDCLLWIAPQEAYAAPETPFADGRQLADTGASALLTETIAPNDFPVVLFGAGHVGAALVRVLGTLPCRVRWVDARDAAFPSAEALAALGVGNAQIDARDAPHEAIDTAPPGTSFVVMTHDHARDLELAERILRRGDYRFFGMIGSHAKRKQFEHSLAARGIDPLQIARMKCPLGIEGVNDKAPEVIAIAAAAQLLQAIDTRAP